MQLDFYDQLMSSDEAATPVLPETLAEASRSYDLGVSDHPQRANFQSNFRMLGRGLGLPLDLIPADPAKLRVLLERANAASAGVKPRAWISGKSVALRALRELGVEITQGRDETPFSPAWAALLEQVSSPKSKIGVSRFVRFLTRKGVEPNNLEPQHFEDYLKELRCSSVRANVDASYRQAVKHWRLCGVAVENWPTIESHPLLKGNGFSLSWDLFPIKFVAEVEEFLASKRDPDPLSDGYTRRVRADTDNGRKNSLRAIASALVLSGQVGIGDIDSLAVLTQTENVRSILRYFRDERFGGSYTPQQINHAELLRTVAKHWEVDAVKADAIGAIVRNLKTAMGSTSGITAKNRQRLAQFDDVGNIERLKELPRTILSKMERGTINHLNATRVMYALQVGLLLTAPIRLKNLGGLTIGQSFVDSGTGKNREVRICLMSEETKSYSDYGAPLPAQLYPLIDAWLNVYRPIVCGVASPLLFPNAQGKLRSREAMSTKLSRFIGRETGLVMNPHLFRHLAAKIYLAHDAAGIEIVRQILGHSSTATTLKSYASLTNDPAFARLSDSYDSAIAKGRVPRKLKGGAA